MALRNNSTSFRQKNAVFDQLKKSRLFSALPDHYLERLLVHFHPQKFAPDDRITTEGERNTQLYFLVKGKVSIYSKGEFILSLKRLGDMCGEMSVMTNKPSLASEVADTDIDAMCLDVNTFINQSPSQQKELNDILFKLYSSMLSDKLALTSKKAKTLDLTRMELDQSKTDLISALRKQDKANQMTVCFMDNIHHELRTPMHGIMGVNDLLRETPLTGKQKEFSDLIQRSAEKLMNNIDDVLDHASLETYQEGKENESFSIRKSIGEICNEFKPAESKKEIVQSSISSDVPDMLNGDRGRLRQAFMNLISFAMENRGKAPVRVKVDKLSASETEPTIRFSVELSSEKIPLSLQQEIFRIFSKKKCAISGDVVKAGLGLFISKQLVEIMDGEIGVINGKNKKLNFWFVLQFNDSNRRKNKRLLSPEAEFKKSFKEIIVPTITTGESRQILLIEDDTFTRTVLRLTLKNLGYDVYSVCGIKEARVSTSLLSFDLIITSYKIAQSAGKQLAKTAPTSDESDRIPVVAYTLKKEDTKKRKSSANELDELIGNPLKGDTLMKAIKRWLPQKMNG